MKLVKSFRANRWIRTTNLVLQAILFFTFFAGLNYLAIRHPWRVDLTHLRSQSLSGETLAYLKKLTQPVKIIVTLRKPDENDDSALAQAYRDLTALLREYVYATEGNPAGRVTFECIDVYQRSREARELELNEPGPTLVQCGEKKHHVGPDELYLIEQKEKKAFLGEQAITAAILDVSSADKKKIYFLNGHGEMDPNSTNDDQGLSALAAELRYRNFEVDRLDLTTRGRIPNDATLIISAGQGQMNRYNAAEEELLRQYLANSTSDRPGRLLLFIPPGLPMNPQLEATGLENLLYDWGILADDVFVRDLNPNSISDNEDLIIDFFDEKHDISKMFAANNLKIRFGAARSIRVNPSRATDESLSVTRLAGTRSELAWGERSYRTRPYRYNSGIDLPGKQIGFAVASERGSAKDKNLGYNVQGGRVVAFASSDFIANNRLSNEGNLTFVLSSINWLTGRGTVLNVQARPIQKFQLTLNQRELERLRYSLLGVLPALAGLLGLIVYWTRRS
ncbi:MAG: Gldg family protein [Nibricoccus sp.]